MLKVVQQHCLDKQTPETYADKRILTLNKRCIGGLNYKYISPELN